MKSITGPDSAVLTGLASIHLVNLSTMTNKYLGLWVPPLRGPTMSSPQTVNGQVMGIVLRVVGGHVALISKELATDASLD